MSLASSELTGLFFFFFSDPPSTTGSGGPSDPVLIVFDPCLWSRTYYGTSSGSERIKWQSRIFPSNANQPKKSQSCCELFRKLAPVDRDRVSWDHPCRAMQQNGPQNAGTPLAHSRDSKRNQRRESLGGDERSDRLGHGSPLPAMLPTYLIHTMYILSRYLQWFVKHI